MDYVCEVTGISMIEYGPMKGMAEITVAHGEEKKKPVNSRNGMECCSDSRATTRIPIPVEAASNFALGDKVMIALAKISSSEKGEYE